MAECSLPVRHCFVSDHEARIKEINCFTVGLISNHFEEELQVILTKVLFQLAKIQWRIQDQNLGGGQLTYVFLPLSRVRPRRGYRWAGLAS